MGLSLSGSIGVGDSDRPPQGGAYSVVPVWKWENSFKLHWHISEHKIPLNTLKCKLNQELNKNNLLKQIIMKIL